MKKKTKQRNSEFFKTRYDEQEGIFIRENEISVNWLLSQVLGEDLQITKVSNEQIQQFLHLLDKSELRMPDGKHSLFWLREKLDEKNQMAEAKQGEVWYKIAERYHYIIEQIDFILMKSGNIKEKMQIMKIEEKKIYRDPNNMEIRFEPMEKDNKSEK